MSELKSFYTLELVVEPGGVRKDHLYVLGSLAEVQRALEVQFSHGFEIGLLLSYGEDIYLSTYHRACRIDRINLLPYIRVEIPRLGIFTIDEEQNVTPPLDEASFDEETDEYTVIIDWSKLNIPELVLPILQPGEVSIFSSYTLDRETIDLFLNSGNDPEVLAYLGDVFYYGWNEMEFGWNEVTEPVEDMPVLTFPVINHVRFQ
ncbi:hypothetical protein [Chamaesiphon minutus]|uniref:Uncharacterized protein n=1 Tax=Chamaesiphon minutus (strain ATCC 27169 / PCC 6605) TaxID=1173020 RepID=K9UK92_CHAP6|nr:hypothetical protein [Chamaesiphon minutus]AFY94846.1 hypothetical protein Cha6605_3878 [Chamaesiphon minutus PCC 6605]